MDDCDIHDDDTAEKLLIQGYEPFAVGEGHIWFRKAIYEDSPELERTDRLATDEEVMELADRARGMTA